METWAYTQELHNLWSKFFFLESLEQNSLFSTFFFLIYFTLVNACNYIDAHMKGQVTSDFASMPMESTNYIST